MTTAREYTYNNYWLGSGNVLHNMHHDTYTILRNLRGKKCKIIGINICNILCNLMLHCDFLQHWIKGNNLHGTLLRLGQPQLYTAK